MARQTVNEFWDQTNGDVMGYGLREDQRHPETYDELVAFMVDRLEISTEDVSVSGLTRWLLAGKENPGSCSPETDRKHVSAVILIAEMEDPDSYVASLPAPHGVVLIPPPNLVRQLLGEQVQ